MNKVMLIGRLTKDPEIRPILNSYMLGQAIGRWGNFVNQEAYGRETTWLFGMTGNLIAREMGEGVLVHPTFLYESLWCLLGFIFLAVYRSKWQTKVGEMTALYLDKILKDKGVLVTRLAHGLPMGASLDYADELTLIKAMDNRRKIQDE